MTTSKIDPERSIDSDAYRGRVSDREEITPGKRRAMPLRTACMAHEKVTQNLKRYENMIQ